MIKDYKLKLRNLHASARIHWVGRGTGTPKHKDEANNEKFASVKGECEI